jgi:hypothetical protein
MGARSRLSSRTRRRRILAYPRPCKDPAAQPVPTLPRTSRCHLERSREFSALPTAKRGRRSFDNLSTAATGKCRVVSPTFAVILSREAQNLVVRLPRVT